MYVPYSAPLARHDRSLLKSLVVSTGRASPRGYAFFIFVRLGGGEGSLRDRHIPSLDVKYYTTIILFCVATFSFALKLKEVFGLADINKLPISYNIAWYEQKAVIVLLALLHLGVKNIRLGPTLPAFLSPNVTNLLVNKFGIAGITTVEDDIKLLG